MFEIQSDSVQKTIRLGRRLAENLQGGEILALTGELGAGKTVFVKGIAEGLGIREVVTSPTFVIVKTYQGRLPLHHMDFYRLNNPQDLDTIGFEDYTGGAGVLAIEWAEKILSEIPRPYIHISFILEENDHRKICIESLDEPAWEINFRNYDKDQPR
jgi:tRNA threonylcarbamoyladenosine biosynthesis protein TsaE